MILCKKDKECDKMLRLRPYKPCDSEEIVKWLKDEDVFYKWSAGRFGSYPLTPEKLNEKYINNNGDCPDKDNFYPFTAFDDTSAVGSIIMRYPTEDKKLIRFGFIIVDSEKRGNGYGKEMLKLALKYAFEILMAEKVTLGVFENNAPAHYCYKSAGFKDVGEEMYTVNGKKWKCIEMECNI